MKLNDLSDSFRFGEKGFEISGVPLEKIVKETGTPVYVYDKNTVARQWNNLRQNMPQRVEIFYAMKANPSLGMVDLLRSFGAGIEIASFGELYTCHGAKVNFDNVVFAGPGKTKRDLKEAVLADIYSINVESSEEIERINCFAKQYDSRPNVSLRINPTWEVKGSVVKMGGGSKQFGIDYEKLRDAAEVLKRSKHINPLGLHIFAATNIQDQEGFIRNMENCFAVAEEIDANHYPVRMIDFGGGEGVKYTDGEKELDLRGIGKRVDEVINRSEFVRKNNPRIIIEPGRYLVAQSGIFVTKTEYVKDSRGKTFLVQDGGINNMLRPTLVKEHPVPHPIFNLSREDQGNSMSATVAGPLCTPLDVLGSGVILPAETREGDLIGVFNAGAYGFTESMPYFLSHDIPAEVLVHDGRYTIIRDRVHSHEFLRNQRLPI